MNRYIVRFIRKNGCNVSIFPFMAIGETEDMKPHTAYAIDALTAGDAKVQAEIEIPPKIIRVGDLKYELDAEISILAIEPVRDTRKGELGNIYADRDPETVTVDASAPIPPDAKLKIDITNTSYNPGYQRAAWQAANNIVQMIRSLRWEFLNKKQGFKNDGMDSQEYEMGIRVEILDTVLGKINAIPLPDDPPKFTGIPQMVPHPTIALFVEEERRRILAIIETFIAAKEEECVESRRNEKGLSGLGHAFEIVAAQDILRLAKSASSAPVLDADSLAFRFGVEARKGGRRMIRDRIQRQLKFYEDEVRDLSSYGNSSAVVADDKTKIRVYNEILEMIEDE